MILYHKPQRRNNKDIEKVCKNPNEIKGYFIIIAEKGFPTKKHVFHIYIKGSQLIFPNIPGTKWELEFNFITQDDVWEDLCAL